MYFIGELAFQFFYQICNEIGRESCEEFASHKVETSDENNSHKTMIAYAR